MLAEQIILSTKVVPDLGKPITNIGDKLTCSAKVVKTFTNGKKKNLALELSVKNQHDDLKLKGHSLVKILWFRILIIHS